MNEPRGTVRRGTAPDTATRYEDGQLLVDQRTGAVGEYKGTLAFEHRIPARVWLRPIGGGQEWDVPPDRVRPADDSEALSARTAAANRASRERSGL